jgi:hypothetical protein
MKQAAFIGMTARARRDAWRFFSRPGLVIVHANGVSENARLTQLGRYRNANRKSL